MSLVINSTTTLEDVCKHYQEVIDEAESDSDYRYQLKELISDYIGDDCISVVLKHPQAFKALSNLGFYQCWACLILDLEGNIDNLIAAGYDRTDVLSAIASSIFMGNPCTNESHSDYVKSYEMHGYDGIKGTVRQYHTINESYLDEIVDDIAELCENMSNPEDEGDENY